MSDPYQILGVTRDASDAEVRAAYLAAVRLCPPERDAQRFSSVRWAFDAIATHPSRLVFDLFNREPPTPDSVLGLLTPLLSPRRPDVTSMLNVLRVADGR